MEDRTYICEECENETELGQFITEGHYQGLCINCAGELKREDACFTRDHVEVFGTFDSEDRGY